MCAQKKEIYFASCAPDGGVYHYQLTGETLTFQEKISCDSPMYLLWTKTRELAVVLKKPFRDSSDSGLVRFAPDGTGHLEQKGEIMSTKGIEGCHLGELEGHVYVANYKTGSIFSETGTLAVHTGKGVHPRRQDAPHVHFTAPSPDGKYLLAVDLGLDTIFTYDRELHVVSTAHVPAGHGPRHLAFSEDGNTIFCVNELASTVTVFAYSDGKLEAMETVPALKKPVENNTAAAIRVEGEYVYVSHRGDDSIACLHWDGGHLRLCTVTSCGGAGPRDFQIVGDLVFCANERSDTISILKVDGEEIQDTGERLSMKAPLCVAVVPTRD